jgi:ubiquitin-hydrolase Zn-finger-containing protein
MAATTLNNKGTEMTTQEQQTATCIHLDEARGVGPRTPQWWEECLRTGSWWVHRRLCLMGGHVGCDDSLNRHAAKHFNRTHYPVVQSLEPVEAWGWVLPG